MLEIGIKDILSLLEWCCRSHGPIAQGNILEDNKVVGYFAISSKKLIKTVEGSIWDMGEIGSPNPLNKAKDTTAYKFGSKALNVEENGVGRAGYIVTNSESQERNTAVGHPTRDFWDPAQIGVCGDGFVDF